MAKPLVIVESPAKARTIANYLKDQYLVKASVGHIKDLPKRGGVDIDNGFQETYELLEEKGKPEVNVYVKRDRAADLGVSPLAVASTVKTLIGGDDVSKFKAEGERYDVSKERIRQLVASDSVGDRLVEKVLGRELGL